MTIASRLLVSLGLAAAVTMPWPAAGQPMLSDAGAVKAITCSACHGAGGNSRSDLMPILAGMDPGYFKKQINDYARGQRPSPEMEPYAKQVLDLGPDDIAVHFARQRMQPTSARVDAAAVERGRTASAECVVCHGKDGKGDKEKLIPSLVGQPPGYLRTQMLLFKQEQRNPQDATLKAMKTLMKTIPDERLADLAAYYSSLR
jgi:cytochrome c553